jgi:hypothetical protein
MLAITALTQLSALVQGRSLRQWPCYICHGQIALGLAASVILIDRSAEWRGRMKTVWLLFLLLTATSASAQVPQVERIDVVEYGIYTANAESRQSMPGSVAGNLTIEKDIRLLQTTRSVPARRGVEFGFRYVAIGAPVGVAVPFHMVTIFPSPGLKNPRQTADHDRNEFDRTKMIGTTQFRSYVLDNDWEVVPGVWIFQVWYQGRKLAEQKFTLVKQ